MFDVKGEISSLTRVRFSRTFLAFTRRSHLSQVSAQRGLGPLANKGVKPPLRHGEEYTGIIFFAEV
jgi:hypothetical protein